MDAPALTWKQIKEFNPCLDSLTAIRAKIKAAHPDYQTRALTLADAHAAGVDFDNLVWIAGRADDRRARLFAADCAARVSHLATDPRSHEAIRCSRFFARGEISAERLSVARDAAWEARDAAKSAARAAVRDEQQWQLERLLAWFSAEEPADWLIADIAATTKAA